MDGAVRVYQQHHHQYCSTWPKQSALFLGLTQQRVRLVGLDINDATGRCLQTESDAVAAMSDESSFHRFATHRKDLYITLVC